MKRTRVIAALAVSRRRGSRAQRLLPGGNGSNSGGPTTISIMEFQADPYRLHEEAASRLRGGDEEAGQEHQGQAGRPTCSPTTQFETKITQQFIAGEAPDVIDLGDSLVPGFAGAGYLAPIDDYLDQVGRLGPLLPAVQEGDGPPGRPDLRPRSRHRACRTSSTARTCSPSCGIDTSQPKTWDDMISRLEQVKAKTGDLPHRASRPEPRGAAARGARASSPSSAASTRTTTA